MADHGIKGKTVLIAGGAKNLGGLLARDLAAHGAKAVAMSTKSSKGQGLVAGASTVIESPIKRTKRSYVASRRNKTSGEEGCPTGLSSRRS